WRVKVMDFGIAHLNPSHQTELGYGELTRPGQAIGTASYMSPEQIKGEVVTALCDVYALGCVMFYMFSGVPPFKNMYRDENVPQIRQVAPGLPPEMEAIVSRCLDRNPKGRPRNA